MKKIIWKSVSVIFFLCAMSACFEDDSTEGALVGNIAISGLEEQYDVVSFIGQKLEIVPEVKADYDEKDLSYSWTVCPVQDANSPEFIQPTEIAQTKNLSYEMNLPQGAYNLKLEVKSLTNDYTINATASLKVATQFSRGFYILKENAEGNSDLDLLLENGTNSVNLLSQMREEGALQGAPLNLSIAYGHAYVDDETQEMVGANLVCVTTKTGGIYMFRDADLKECFTRENLLYDNMDADEKPYGVLSGMWCIHYYSNKGVCSNYASFMMPSTGKYGMSPTSTGASTNITFAGYNSYYWDEDNHKLWICDYNGGLAEVTDADGDNLDLSGFDCISSGTSRLETPLFIMEEKATKKRYVYIVNNLGSVKETYLINEKSHLASSSLIRVNGQQAVLLYGVDNNALYVYDWTTEAERKVTLQGISDGETINYLSNQFYRDLYDYLIVGTTKGGKDYTLRMYKMVGGVPDGKPVLTATGEGRVNNVRFLNSSFEYTDLYMGTTFPLGE